MAYPSTAATSISITILIEYSLIIKRGMSFEISEALLVGIIRLFH